MYKEKRSVVLVMLFILLFNLSLVEAGTMKLYGNVDGEIYLEKSTDSKVTKNFEDLYVWIKDDDPWPNEDDDMGSSPYNTNSIGDYDTGWISNIGDPWPDEEAEVYIRSYLRGPYVKLHNDQLFGGEDKHIYDIGHLSTSYQHDWNWDNDASVYWDGTNLVIEGGDLDINGEVDASGVSGDGSGKVVCVKSDGDLGTCSDAPDGSGVCSCG